MFTRKVTSIAQLLRLDTRQGAGEKRTEVYRKYIEGASQPATQYGAKNVSSVIGHADEQADMAQRLGDE